MKYHIITYGCQMNKSDSEKIATVLEKCGYKPINARYSIDGLAKADLIVVNMCSVRQSAVDRIYGLLPKFKKLKTKNPKLKTILTGCILKTDKKKFQNKFDLILDIKNLPDWPSFLEKRKNPIIHLEQSNKIKCDYLKIKPKRRNSFLAFVPISNGCNNFCSYCVVPFTRGPLVCRPYKEVLKEIKNAAKNGYKEIWLLGQNVNDYTSKTKNPKSKTNQTPNTLTSKKISFATLLKMINKIPGDFKFFFTSPYPKNFSDELINTLAECEKFGKYLNLPVQSGDDKILKKMNRNYTIQEYKNLVKKIRQKIPDIRLSTDVIVGFPGETKKQFENTVKLFKEIKFNFAYIAKYSPRPGTIAFKLKDDISLTEKKKREKILRRIIEKK